MRSNAITRKFAIRFGIVAAVAIGAIVPTAQAATVTIPGSPLQVFTNQDGRLQAGFDGSVSKVFYPPTDTEGDSTFVVGLRDAVHGLVAGTTAGPTGLQAGPTFTQPYESVLQGPVLGSGTAGSPYTQSTDYLVRGADSSVVLEIRQTVTYVNGSRSFGVQWTIENSSGSAVRYRASAAADLFLDGDDSGVGYFTEGPPRIIGGINEVTGRAGGIQEVATSPWDRHQEARFSSIWDIVTEPLTAGFNDTLLADNLDNGVGVQWDDRYEVGIPNGATDTYRVVWQFGVNGLTATPLAAVFNQGATHTVTFTGTDENGGPVVGKLLRYGITGPNPSSGGVTTNGQGQASVAWVGNHAGTDVIDAYLDLNGDGTRGNDEPKAAATVLFKAPDAPLPVPPTAPGNAFTFDGKPIFGNGSTTLVIVVPGPGQISVTPASSASASIAAKKKNAKGKKKAKKKPALIKNTTVNATKAGPVRVKIKPTKAGKKVLKRKGKLTTKVNVTFTPTGGQANTVTHKVTIKQKTAKPKKGKGGKGKGKGKR
jgi:hypothetical protein